MSQRACPRLIISLQLLGILVVILFDVGLDAEHQIDLLVLGCVFLGAEWAFCQVQPPKPKQALANPEQPHTQTHRHTDTQTHRHTDTQTHRHTDTQTHRHTDTHTHTHTLSDRVRQTETDSQTDTHTHTEMYIYI